MNNTKYKGDLATALVIADLTKKGYYVFVPAITEHLPFDLIAYKDNKCLRIQCKYQGAPNFANRCQTSWSNKSGCHNISYKKSDFDYYAIYLATKDVIVYPSIMFEGKTIRTNLPKTNSNRFYWYEDLVNFTDSFVPKKLEDFIVIKKATITKQKKEVIRKERTTKINWPSPEELQKLLFEMPMTKISQQLGVSDVAIKKHLIKFNLEKPPVGYWLQKE